MNTFIPARFARTALVLGTLLAAGPAAAYVGPGAGLSLLGALWAVVATIAAALFFLLMWPLRRLFRRSAGNGAAATAHGAAAAKVDAQRLPPRRAA